MLDIIKKEDVLKFIKRTVEYPDMALKSVQQILKEVSINGDNAVKRYTEQFDNCIVKNIKVTEEEIIKAYKSIDQQLIEDLNIAEKNIREFHKMQIQNGYKKEVLSNSYVGQIVNPIETVGLYIPGGTAAYPSTVLMSAVPAKIAGVKKIVLISPPNQNGEIPEIILASAKIAGVDEIYKVGGAQGIAALAYGTSQIPKVDKIMGPGNMYVALAKKEVFGIVGIDMIAGPSEITILADESATPSYIAADLIAQAEHDEMASSILVTTSKVIALQVQEELKDQVSNCSRKNIIKSSFDNYGGIIIVDSIDEGIEVVNNIGPEHLELMIKKPDNIVSKIKNAGAIFIGDYSPESLGDYIAGPNHTLPTNGTSRFSSPLSVDDFIKKTSIIKYSKNDLKKYKDSIYRIAMKEELDGHANAALVRFKDES